MFTCNYLRQLAFLAIVCIFCYSRTFAATICGDEDLYCFGDDLTPLIFDNVFESGLTSDCGAFNEDKRPPSAFFHHNSGQLTVALRYHTIGDLSLFRLGNFDISGADGIQKVAVRSWADLGNSSFYGPQDTANLNSTTESQRILNFGPAIASNESFVIFSAVDGYVGFSSKPRASLVYYNHKTQSAFFQHNHALIKDTIEAPARVVLSIHHPDQADSAFVVANLGGALRMYKFSVFANDWTTLLEFPSDTNINGGTFVPMGGSGLIIFFMYSTMQQALIYDISDNKMFSQRLSEGDIPEFRAGPCISTVSARDGSSHQVHVTFGASSMVDNKPSVFAEDNHYILTLPKFRWIKVPGIDTSRSQAVCGLANGRNQLSYGGFRPEQEKSSACNGQINIFDLSEFTPIKKIQSGDYFVPGIVRQVVGGSDKGCGNSSIPKGYLTEPLSMALAAPYTLRDFEQLSDEHCTSETTSTKTKPNGSGKPKLSTKVIVAIVVSVIIGLILVLALGYFVWKRRNSEPQAASALSFKDTSERASVWVAKHALPAFEHGIPPESTVDEHAHDGPQMQDVNAGTGSQTLVFHMDEGGQPGAQSHANAAENATAPIQTASQHHHDGNNLNSYTQADQNWTHQTGTQSSNGNNFSLEFRDDHSTGR